MSTRRGRGGEWVVLSQRIYLRLIWCYAVGITYDNTQTLKIGRSYPYKVENSAFFTLHEYEKNQPLSSSGSGSDGRQTAMMNETK